MHTPDFKNRHIGPSDQDTKEMLNKIGVSSIQQLIDETVPSQIKLNQSLHLPQPLSEFDYLNHINEIAQKNKLFKTYIGQGYYNCIVPSVIKRNILENPGWYTAYTPYQAEISQGRLAALLNFQTMIIELTGLEIANASLLDEATAAAEAMNLLFNSRTRDQVKNNVNKFFVSKNCFIQTIDVIKTRALPIGIELVIEDETQVSIDNSYFGAIIQYPNKYGEVVDYGDFVSKAKSVDCKIVVATDILSLALLTPPGEWGADVVVGSTQRFGVPMGYGGPHAAFFATKDEYKRNIPGRIIGVSVDKYGKYALRMALQTREQHIRRDKATSNICTAQALLAIMASMYAVYHGPNGIKSIAEKTHQHTLSLKNALSNMGIHVINRSFFDTITVQFSDSEELQKVKNTALENKINFNYFDAKTLSISLDETVSNQSINEIVAVFAQALNKKAAFITDKNTETAITRRKSPILSHPIFNRYHSETEMMRYIKSLENKDISLTHSMISLGSCTMKLNAASELYPITMPEFANMHPFVPSEQALGYHEIISNLGNWLAEITGFDAVSFQPNSGAQGEYAGLLVIMAYLKNKGEGHRNIALIPSSAHGTNPASAVMAGMEVVVVKCDEQGNIDVADLKEKAEKHKENLACLMVTYPSTHGVFEESIQEITSIIHQFGGQVYMDGANMNAQVGVTNPGNIGADVCHLNLHKTFAIPHGGGGPGVGPIGVAKHLTPFLPKHAIIETGGAKGIHAVSAAPMGSALILLISYAYVRMLGAEGVLASTQYAILNANYLKAHLQNDYPVLYQGKKGRVAHEMILDCRDFKRTAGIEVEDIAKRLIDYGFHAPTVSFPVAGTLMIEPTESESKAELDRFIETMKSIRQEIKEIETGVYKEDNVLKNAPHTAEILLDDSWQKPYSRKKAAYPLSWLNNNKYWVPVGRVDNAYGDRNLVCACLPIEDYIKEEVVS
jgi:glycine dehydrogenase